MLELTSSVARFIDRVYELACEASPATFKQRVYHALSELIAADAGIWTSRSDLKKPIPQYWKEDTFVFNLPDEFMSNYHQVVSNHKVPDPFHQLIIKMPNQAHKIVSAYGSVAQWRGDLYYSKHCELFNVEDVLSVLAVPQEQGPQTIHLISLYRKTRSQGFTDQEVELFQLLYPQLVEAFRINLFTQVSRDFVDNQSAGSMAVMDRFGHLLDADCDFERLLDFAADFDLAHLKQLVKGSCHKQQHNTGQLQINIQFHNGLFFIKVLPIDYFGRLTEQQLQVCCYIQQGFSDEDIARRLGSSHRQVRYLLDDIFSCLKVNNRNDLIFLLKKLGFKAL